MITIMLRNKKGLPFACFSPPVMVATFIFEIISMVYVLVKYKLNTRSKLISALLFNLAIFQIAEYNVCQNTLNAEIASRIGYASITLLPVLGLHLMAEISKSKLTKQIIGSYALAAAVATYFLIHPESFQSYECTGNYVIFQIGKYQAWIYSFYYFGIILGTMILGLKKRRTVNKKDKKDISMLMLGYVVFILPVSILTVLHPDTRKAIPSILCGFAVLFAVILVTKVAPLALRKR